LDTLEHWLDVIPTLISPNLNEILPSLEPFLLIPVEETGDSTETERPNVINSRGGTQRRIITLLGSLGGKAISLIGESNLTSQGTESSVGIAWDTNQRIKFAVPFVDLKAEFYFDSLLPRIVELALHANDRQIKTVASEVLHAIILYILGYNSRRNTEGENSNVS
jgi:hypothetical protein